MKRSAIQRRTPLRRMGKDKARETAKYWPLRREYIAKHAFCEFPISRDNESVFTPTCMSRTSSIHHKKGQHWKVMNDTRYWLATCIDHHAWIEDNKREARKRGLILYR